jgi:hypothetical protein
MNIDQIFQPRSLPQSRKVNFVVGTKAGFDERKAYLVELDPSYEGRVGDLLEAHDKRTNRNYLLMISDIDPAYPHGEQHAEMLDLLRRRSDKEIDDATFNALCKNMALCTLLGEISHGQIVENGYRPNKYVTIADVAGMPIEQMLVDDWQEGVLLGHLRVGRNQRPSLHVQFPTIALAGGRFLIVGQTGKGKSNAMRQILDGHLRYMDQHREARRVGFLVDDFKMEYPFDTYNQRGDIVPGLAHKLGPIAKQRLVILTCHPDRYTQHKNDVRDILPLSIPLDSISLSIFAELAELTPAQTNVVRLVEDSGRTTATQFFHDLFAVDEYGMPEVLGWAKKYGRIFYSKQGRTKARKGTDIVDEDDIDSNLLERLAYIRRAASRLLNLPFMRLNKGDGDCLPDLLEYLAEGCTVIVDKSGLEDHQRELLTVMLLSRLFRHNQELASGSEQERNQMIPVVVAVEEAQYLLSKDKVADPDSIFAKIAFTGRSYQIGLLAITQRPQAIQKELLGQFDGFLVLPMEHLNDFKHLADACPALAGYREDLAASPVGGGVLAYGSPKRVVSIQIENYKHEQG